MLVNEARWLGNWIAAQPSTTLFPIASIDGPSHRVRTQQQPWIEQFVFGPARVRGEVVHIDRAATGVRRFPTVVCSNVLQRAADLPGMSTRLWSTVEDGGHLVLTGPYEYPLDDGLRARPEQLASLFPHAVVVEQRIVEDYTFARYVFRTPWHVLEELARTVSTARRQHWSVNLTRWAWLRRPFSASVVVLAKPGRPN